MEEKEFDLTYVLDKIGTSKETVVFVTAHRREKTAYSEAGYEIAFGQKAVRKENATVIDAGSSYALNNALKVVNSHDNVGVIGESFEVLFSKPHGGIASYIYAGKEMIRTIPRPNFWRAPVENDNGNRDPLRMGMWKTASSFQSRVNPNAESTYGGDESDSKYPKISENKDSVDVVFARYLGTFPVSRCLITYRVFTDGTVRVFLDYDKKKDTPDMPEFGFMFFMDADYDHVKWYGYGPEETYCDRFNGGKLSVYSNLVKDNVQPYLVPQETGNKVGVRWAEVTDIKGRGLIFKGVDDGTESKDRYGRRSENEKIYI